ncbi:TapB family protein [Spongiimicrobium salis]|uniref:TapB family protein n=1 Tax=Spongiimicrobium salis TaxID=1667022 RepID=UPI00374CB89B
MKKILYLILVLLIGTQAYAQECNAAVFLKKGAKLTYTDYTKKGKVESTSVHETLEITEEEGSLIAAIKATLFNAKGQEQFTTEYAAGCKNGLFYMDMLRFFDMGKLAEHDQKDIELIIDGDVLYFPVNMQAGEVLEDGNINIKVNANDFTVVTMTFTIFNRKILPNETITTSAGTFDCQVVTFDFESKFGIIKVRGSGKEWYKEDKAVVKSESYNKRGKLLGYHELTAIK